MRSCSDTSATARDMNERINLKELERRAWTSYFQDGLWDIFLGLLLLNFGIAPLFEAITHLPYLVSYLSIIAVAELIFLGGKKYITIPRIGRVTFDHSRQIKRRRVAIVLGISVGLGIVASLVFQAFAPIPAAATLFSVNSLIVFSCMAYLMEFPRLYIYGIFFAASIPLTELLRPLVGPAMAPLIGFGLFGLVATSIGLAYFLLFLREYPTPGTGVANGV